MGRPRDTAPKGFVTVREAADLLGISGAAVRQRIKRGALPSEEGHVSDRLESRHYIPHEAIEREIIEKGLPANRGHVEASAETVIARVEMAIEEAAEAVRLQDEHVSARLDKLRRGQEEIKAQVSGAVSLLREAAELEKEYQRRMIAMLDREAERQREREEKGLPERRSLWRRWFGEG